MAATKSFCAECCMRVTKNEFHPFAACVMYKVLQDKKAVLANMEEWLLLREQRAKITRALDANLTPANKISLIHQALRGRPL